jgi:16S rRNA (guanine966-N2)-methyltransferase
MRVVAGTAGGRRLVAPRGRSTRPTSDRVREAVFNSLVSLGAVEDARVLDLFAGTGALGIEALSRGAARATFVERDERTVATIWANLVRTGLQDRAAVAVSDAIGWLSRRAAEGPIDVALVDPPYTFDDWETLLDELAAVPVEVAVLESNRAIEPGANWQVVRAKSYGGTVVTILRRQPPDSEEE